MLGMFLIGRGKNMKKRSKAEGTQVDRFIEAARELGADVPEEEFDRALRKVCQKREKSGGRIDKKNDRRQ